MKKPRKPKAIKPPKMPKKGASLATLKNYERRLADVQRRNAERAREYNRKIGEIQQAKKLYTTLASKRHSQKSKMHLKVA